MSKEIIVRKIKNEEREELLKLIRKSCSLIKKLFVMNYKNSMVAIVDNKIVGGITYKIINCDNKKIVYISNYFIDKNYKKKEIIKKLYKDTIINIRKEKVDGITAFSESDCDDTIKALMDNGLKQTSFIDLIKKIGFINAIKYYFMTPFSFAIGMDFYTDMKEVKEKKSQIFQLLMFLLLNLVLTIPIWVRTLKVHTSNFIALFLAYITILLVSLITRYIGVLTTKERWNFHISNGGFIINLLVNFLSFPYMINGNWYPQKYENSKEFNEKLARLELIKWFVFLFLPFLYFSDIVYLKKVAQLSFIYLIFFIIPIYPFDYFGGGRIYRYSKKIWTIVLVVTLLFLFFMSNITLI